MATQEKFLQDVKDHTMTVLADDGNGNRILRFQNVNGDIHQYFTITTWSNWLVYAGDMGTYVFRNSGDMLRFFNYSINPSYWEDKLTAMDIDKRRKPRVRREFSYSFMWCCYALAWAAKTYFDSLPVIDNEITW